MASRQTGNKPEPRAATPATAASVRDEDGDEDGDDDDDRDRAPDADDGRIQVELHHERSRHVRWILIGAILGGLFVVGLGTLGKVLGLVLIALGAWNLFLFIRTLRHPPGAIVIDGDTVLLPRGVCRGEPTRVERSQVTATYFLRRAVPWTQASPVLVIEAGGRAFLFPRDWFAGEADQRRVIDALAPA